MAHLLRQAAGFSRRDLLKGIGVGAAALGTGMSLNIGGRRVYAQPAPMGGATAFMRFPLGDLEVTIIQDGGIPIAPEGFAVNADPADVIAALEANNYPTGQQNATIDVTLVRSGDALVLLDSGVGSAFGVPPRLTPTLELLGIAPSDITNIIISHFHIDHLAGIINSEGGLTFPNASVHMAQAEYDFLTNATGLPEAAQQSVDGALAQLQPAVDADALVLYADGEELLTGISVLAAPGHSPGQHATVLSSGGMNYINIADVATHPFISLYNPDWHFTFDADPLTAAATRRTILQRAVDENWIVFGYHFPFPGIGVVDTDGDGFRFMPYGV
jgi:glyoxylase-like metal-dependent hydrolase (beta-lactamase superfamily II)